MNHKQVEILAPVGSYESLTAALKSGCNSIYFGIEQLNMRARSSINFTLEDLKKIGRICREQDIRSYYTLKRVTYFLALWLLENLNRSEI